MKLRVNEAAPVKMRLDTSCPAPFLPLLLTESLGKVGVSGSTAVSVKDVQVEGVDPYDALLVVVTADELKIPRKCYGVFGWDSVPCVVSRKSGLNQQIVRDSCAPFA